MAGKLPKRFEPFLNQALTEADLRYGAQEAALGSILGQLNRNHNRNLDAQATANSSLVGLLKGQDANVERYYSESGLTPTVLSQLAQDPSGRRLAGEMAGYRSQNQAAMTGQIAGDQFQRSRINQEYGDQLGQFGDQFTAMQRERGTFTSALLDQLIGEDRKARQAANAAARQQQHDDAQAALGMDAAQTNALIGQGLLPQPDGTLAPLPGGKADPNAPGNQPKPKKRTTGPGTASPDAQRSASTDFTKATSLAKGMIGNQPLTPELRAALTKNLTNGRPASGGDVIYEEVPVLGADGKQKKDAAGNPITKRVPKVDPTTGTRVTTRALPALPSFDATIAAAATEQAMFGYVTTATVRELQKLGYSVNQIPGLKTENQRRRTQPKAPTTQRRNPPKAGDSRPGNIRDIYG